MQLWSHERANEVMKVGWRTLVRKYFIQPDGKSAEYVTKDPIGSESSAVVALTGDNQVIIAKQFRPGPEKIMFELPGGAIEGNELPLSAATRELQEETGYQAGSIEPIGMAYEDAYSNHKTHYFFATNCVASGGQNLDDNEFIDVELISIDDLLQNARQQKMSDVAAIYLAYERLGKINKERDV